MILPLLVVILICYLVIALLYGYIPIPARKEKKDMFGRDEDAKIDRIKQNYVNGAIDDITMEKALDDVMNGRPNSYGEAIYDAEVNPSKALCDRMMAVPADTPAMPNVSPAPHHADYVFNMKKGSVYRIGNKSYRIAQKRGEILDDKDDFDIDNIL